jgi:hypothetical protein
MEEENRKRKLEEQLLEDHAQQLLMHEYTNAVSEQDTIEDMMMMMLLALGELDDPDEEIATTWGGSRPGKARNKDRDSKAAFETVTKQYFPFAGGVRLLRL